MKVCTYVLLLTEAAATHHWADVRSKVVANHMVRKEVSEEGTVVSLERLYLFLLLVDLCVCVWKKGVSITCVYTRTLCICFVYNLRMYGFFNTTNLHPLQKVDSPCVLVLTSNEYTSKACETDVD